ELTLAIELPNQPTVETLAPDRFPMRGDSPLSAEHRLLSEIYEEFVGTRDYFRPRLTGSKHGTAIAKMEGRQRGRLLLAAAERADNAWSASNDAEPAVWQSRYLVGPIAGGLAGMGVALDWPHIVDYLLFVATRVPAHARGEHNGAVEYCLSEI